MAKMGRPRKEIDRDQFEKLCAIWTTLEEIAGWFECSVDTIERWVKRTYQKSFAETYAEKCSRGKVSLRRKQFEVAMSGSVPMLIFLGKQQLGQSDQVTHTNYQLDMSSPQKERTPEQERVIREAREVLFKKLQEKIETERSRSDEQASEGNVVFIKPS